MTASPQRVLHVLNSATGGAALSTLGLMEKLTAHGVQSSALCHDAGSSEDRQRLTEAVEGRIRFRRLYWWNSKIRMPAWRRPLSEIKQGLLTGWARSSTRGVVEAAERWHADLIHTNTILTPEGGLAAQRLRLPHVWHLREMVGPGQPFRLPYEGPAFGHYMSTHCSRLIANSKASAAAIRGWISDELLEVIPNGVDISRFQPRTETPHSGTPHTGRIVVAMVGNLTSHWKKHAVFVEAAARVDRSLPIEFRIYGHDPSHNGTVSGDPYTDNLNARIATAGLKDRFILAGFVADPVEVMNQIDILVHTADSESFGRIAVEGMARALPVIGVQGGGVAEIVQHGETGLLAPIDDAGQIAAYIEKLVRQPELARAMGTAGRQRATTHYSMDACANGVLRVYQQAMLRPLGAPVSGHPQSLAAST